ncbi:SEP domain-containing protein [Dipodascopsis uninucleata]
MAPKIRTLSDLNDDSAGPSGGSGGGSPFSRSPSRQIGSDDDGETYVNPYRSQRQPEDLFTGGEKSGLAVQNPDASDRGRLVRDILRQAELGGRTRDDEPQVSVNRFSGRGHVLGSESEESQPVEEEPTSTNEPEFGPTVTRTLTFWRDGFTIESGSLMRYDDPANQEILRAINGGRAPLHLLNVNPGQPVDVRVERKMDEDYKPPNPSSGGFFGNGHRLGS